MQKSLTLEEVEDYAFYESGLSADGCLNNLDTYARESIKSYGRILLKTFMNNTKQNYTPDGMHPEDAIYTVKIFVNELQKIQNEYFNKLVADLNLNKEGEDWLFDYIFNSDDEVDDFSHYLSNYNREYSSFTNRKDILFNSLDTVGAAEHMSSYEADLETTFPSAYNDNEPISFGLDTITIDTNTVKEH